MGEGNVAVTFVNVNVNGQVLEISRNYFTVTHNRIDCGLRAIPAKIRNERLPCQTSSYAFRLLIVRAMRVNYES